MEHSLQRGRNLEVIQRRIPQHSTNLYPRSDGQACMCTGTPTHTLSLLCSVPHKWSSVLHLYVLSHRVSADSFFHSWCQFCRWSEWLILRWYCADRHPTKPHPGQSVLQASSLRVLKAGQGQDKLCYPWNFIPELCCPLELPVLMMKIFTVQYGSLGPHVTVGHLKYGYCEWGAELFIVFNFN